MSSSISIAARTLGVRRCSTLLSSSSRISPSSYILPSYSSQLDPLLLQQQRRWKSKDVGDVIGIDLGTTNSCVAIMVRVLKTQLLLVVFVFLYKNAVW